jgi:very-short-patch-repair endonuclease
MADAFQRAGLTPVRQHEVEWYMVDFALIEHRLIVECDGKYWHNLPRMKARDKAKDTYFRRHGWAMLRLGEDEINASPDDCARKVIAALKERNAMPLFASLIGKEGEPDMTVPIACHVSAS